MAVLGNAILSQNYVHDRTATVEILDESGIIGSNSIIPLTVAPKDTLDSGSMSSSTTLPSGQPAQ